MLYRADKPAKGKTRLDDLLMTESVCGQHVPTYAKDGRPLEHSTAPCVVCGEQSVIILPAITTSGSERLLY